MNVLDTAFRSPHFVVQTSDMGIPISALNQVVTGYNIL